MSDESAIRRYEAIAVDYPLSECATIGDFRRVIAAKPKNETERRARLREILVFHYGSVLTADHPRLTALSSAVSIARQISPRVVCYITPINAESAARNVGPELCDIVAQNVALIRSTVGDVLDWSNAMGENSFFSPDDATEHLNETGRRRLTELIVSHIDQ